MLTVLSAELGPVGLALVFRVCILHVFLNNGHFILLELVFLCFWCVFALGVLSLVVPKQCNQLPGKTRLQNVLVTAVVSATRMSDRLACFWPVKLQYHFRHLAEAH